LHLRATWAAVGVAIESTARASRPHGCQQWLDADDVQHTREIVAEYVQRHFGRDIGQPLHQKVRRTHPHLQRGERMLDGFAAHTHGLRVLIEPRLRGLDDVFVFPAFDAALVGRCALILERACAARMTASSESEVGSSTE